MEFALCWLVVIFSLGLAVWILTKKHTARFWSLRNSARIVLRSFVLSLAFAPSALFGGLVGFPAPASFMLAWYIVSPRDRSMLSTSAAISLTSLLVTWYILVFICASRLLRTISEEETPAA